MKKLFLVALLLAGCDTIVVQYEEATDEADSGDSTSATRDTSPDTSVNTDSNSSSSDSDTSISSVETQTTSDTSETSTETETGSQTVDTDTFDGCEVGTYLCVPDPKEMDNLFKCSSFERWVRVNMCEYCDNGGGCYDCYEGEETCSSICVNRKWKDRLKEGLPAFCPDGYSCGYTPGGEMYCYLN
jgi:hypothetical protein